MIDIRPSDSLEYLEDSLEGIESYLDKLCLDRRSSRPDISTMTMSSYRDVESVDIPRKYYDLICILVICTFKPDLLGDIWAYCSIEVEGYLEKNLLFPEILALAKLRGAKASFLYVLLHFSKCKNVQSLYSSVLQGERVQKILSHIRLVYEKRPRSRRLQRHKGYRDHGTLRPRHSWLESHDVSLTELQNTLEERRETYDNDVLTILQTAEDWYIEQRNTVERSKSTWKNKKEA